MDVVCRGTESRVQDCQLEDRGQSYSCGYNREQANVSCYGGLEGYGSCLNVGNELFF